MRGKGGLEVSELALLPLKTSLKIMDVKIIIFELLGESSAV